MPSIGILGCGNLGSAVVSCLLNDGFEPNLLKVIDNTPAKVQSLGIEPASLADLAEVEVLVLTVKPANIKDAVSQLKLSPESVVVSMAAGVTIEQLIGFLPADQPICRVMPNIGVKIGAGVLAITFSDKVNNSQKMQIKDIFSPLGRIVEIKEKDFDTVTALVGGGPAFAAHILEGCIMGGIAGGLSRQIAEELLLETFTSTIELMRSGIKAEDIRFMVSSPGGSTIEGLGILEKEGVKGAIINAIKSSAQKAGSLFKTKE